MYTWQTHSSCHSNKVNLHFNSSLHSQSAVVVSEQCDRGQELNYVVFYTGSSGPQSNFTISPESCTNSVCQHTLNMPSAADYTVSVAAVNVVGQRRSNESISISECDSIFGWNLSLTHCPLRYPGALVFQLMFCFGTQNVCSWWCKYYMKMEIWWSS